MLNAIGLDIEIVQVPPERDAETERKTREMSVTRPPKR